MPIQPQALWRSILILSGLVLVLAFIALRSGGVSRVIESLKCGSNLFIQVLPNLILGFALAGFLYVLLPGDIISKFMGSESGFRGLMVGTVAGSLTPGGPFTHFPIVAAFLEKGASVGPVCAYVTSWALLGVNRFVVWELPILGPKVAFSRFLASLLCPVLVGWISSVVYRFWSFH